MSTVLITGAARGLGLEFVKQYAARGWKVHACARSPESLKEVTGNIHLHKLEVTDYGAVKALASELKGEAIDVLVCNAGVSGSEAGDLGRIDPKVWRNTFEVNALAPLMMAEAFVEQVAASKDRKLIAISSRLGSITHNDGARYAYRASKTALNMEWQSLSKDTAAKGLICVVLHPGWVQTDMGGKAATLTIAQSVPSMVKVIDGLKPADNGRFLNYDGTELPW
ncbi:SDR family oxidoreductase [Reyranella sp.]|uniref:SDR family oxidoreductase n=1 Tax=Reyranella sp. TaxID=1929291 RepID=UPI00272288A2|nr:SDR family oxidoreductase [Reyranella sp.]MDO8973719.1 SDR family oxidoreductase [Reyranella sp.]